MAHFPRIRLFGGWAASTVWTPTEAQQADNQMFAAINGDGGGTWAPTSIITVTGAFGFQAYTLRGGNVDGFGAPAFIAEDDHVDFISGAVVTYGSTTSTDWGASHTWAGTVLSTLQIRTPGNKVLLNDSTFPTRTPNVSFTDRVLRFWFLSASGSMTVGASPGTISYSNTSATIAEFEVELNHNCTYSNIEISIKGGAGHGGVAPAVLPVFSFHEVDELGNFTSLASGTLTPASMAAYESGVVFPFSISLTPNVNRRYVARLANENGANAQAGLTLRGFRADGSVVSFGRTREL